jgi:hypothetical protein
MKLFIFSLLTVTTFYSYSQTSECLSSGAGKKPMYDAQKAKKAALVMDSSKNIAGAISEFKKELEFRLKAESLCPDFDAKNYGFIQRVINDLMKRDTANAKIYYDTLNSLFERMDKKGIANLSNFDRGNLYLKGTKMNREKADQSYKKGLTDPNGKVTDELIQNYYFNIYSSFNEANEKDKLSIKVRLISEYFELSSLCSEKKLNENTLTYLTNTINMVIKTCSDILPDVSLYLKKLPQDNTQKIKTVENLINIVEEKGCTSSDEYSILIDTLVTIDKSYKALLAKARLQLNKGNTSDAMSLFKEAKNRATTEEEKKEIEAKITYIQEKIAAQAAAAAAAAAAQEYNNVVSLFNSGSYKSAYSAGKALTGKYRGEGLKIAGQCVGLLANSCGTTTFERKCNYYHAIELLRLAQGAGANVGGLISSYNSLLPSADEKFDAGNPKSQFLSCWGVSVGL